MPTAEYLRRVARTDFVVNHDSFEIRLWVAILARALRDAHLSPRSLENRHWRRDARLFFEDGSAAKVLMMVGFREEQARAVIDEIATWRTENDRRHHPPRGQAGPTSPRLEAQGGAQNGRQGSRPW